MHFNDFMFDDRSAEGIASYLERGLNVLAQVENALALAGSSYKAVESWLDFGCGYGRVLRFLVERVPAARVTASDVVREGVDFCSSEFGVRPLYSTANLAMARLGSFDFIYAISVLAHMNERNSRSLLRLLGESVKPGGILLFTTHGRWSLAHPELYGEEYVDRHAEISGEVDRRGSYFLPYPYLRGEDYGMAWHSREHIEQLVHDLHRNELVLLFFEEHGLDGHQDVFAFRRQVTVVST